MIEPTTLCWLQDCAIKSYPNNHENVRCANILYATSNSNWLLLQSLYIHCIKQQACTYVSCYKIPKVISLPPTVTWKLWTAVRLKILRQLIKSGLMLCFNFLLVFSLVLVCKRFREGLQHWLKIPLCLAVWRELFSKFVGAYRKVST